MSEIFEILEWDSNFFGCRVAQIKDDVLSGKDFSTCLKDLALQDVKLAYYFSTFPLEEEKKNDDYHISLTNKRIPIQKNLSAISEIHNKISSYENPVPNEDLMNLAYRAGVFSRFNLDPNIKGEKVRELYKIWIEKSVQKEMATKTLVYKEEDKIQGFVTLIVEPPKGRTPLFAVSEEAEGKGVSFALMRAVDTILFQMGCSYYISATQAENKAALTVFQRHGFELKPVEYVYHLWKK